MLFIDVGYLRAPKMNIKIMRVINYLESGPITLYTVKRKQELDTNNVMAMIMTEYREEDFGVIDYINTGPIMANLLPSTPQVRIIMPNTYVSERNQRAIIMIDSENPS